MPQSRAVVQALSLVNKETTYGVVSDPYLAAMTDWLAPTEADFAEIHPTWSDDGDEINGQAGPTVANLLMKAGTLPRKYNASTEVLAYYLALMLGNVTSGSASSAATAVQTITVAGTPTGGQFTLTFKGETTIPMLYNVAAATMQTNLQALGTIGSGGVTVSGTPGTSYVITFAGALVSSKQPDMVVQITTALTGGTTPTITLATTTPGSAAGAYLHTIKWPSVCTLNPASFALMEGLACGGSTATYKLYAGAVVDTLALAMNGKGNLALTVGVKFDGREQDRASFTFPVAATPTTKLTGGMVTCYFGATTTTALPASSLRDLQVNMTAGVVEPPVISSNSYVEEMQYGDRQPGISISFNVKGDKSSAVWQAFIAAMDSGTRYKFQMVIQPYANPQRSVTLVCNSVLPEVKATKQGSETRLAVTLRPFFNTTDSGPAVWTLETGKAAYLTAI